MMNEIISRLIDKVQQHAYLGKSVEFYPGYSVFTASTTNCPVTVLYQPMLCLVLQGSKEVIVGDRQFQYKPGDYFINSVELPIATRIIESDVNQPYMSISIQLDPDKLAQIMTETDISHRKAMNDECFLLSRASENLLEPLSRMLDLFKNEQDVAFLAPMVDREILYRLLKGEQSSILRQISGNDFRVNKVREVINWVKDNFNKAISIQNLIEQAGMSQASLHRHFRTATGMTPLQYQKTLRLQEARKLLLEGKEVSETAYDVGYESPSQFSREYSRMYGRSPSQDAKRLNDLGASVQDISNAPW